MLQCGRLRAAVQALRELTVSLPVTPAIVQQLRDTKFPDGPPAAEWMPPAGVLEAAGRKALTKDDVVTALERTKYGGSAGPSGWSMDNLRIYVKNALADEESERAQTLLQFLTMVAHGEFPTAARPILYAMRGTVLGADGKLRPIAVQEAWCQLAHAALKVAVLKRIDEACKSLLHNFGVGFAGGNEIAGVSARTLRAAHPSWVVAKLDVSNAYGTIRRADVVAGLRWAGLTSLLPAFIALYGHETSIMFTDAESGGGLPLAVRTGVVQGHPLSSIFFAVGLAHAMRGVIPAGNPTQSITLADDMTLGGPAADLLTVEERLTPQLAAAGMVKNADKSRYLLGASTTEADEALIKAHLAASGASAAVVEESVRRDGITIAGVPVGTDAYQQEALQACRDRAIKVLRASAALLAHQWYSPKVKDLAHILLCVARDSVAHMMEHLTRVVEPRLAVPYAEQLDNQLAHFVLRDVANLREDEITQVDISRVFLPAQLGGLGLSSTAKRAKASYVACAALILQYVARYTGGALLTLPGPVGPAAAPAAAAPARPPAAGDVDGAEAPAPNALGQGAAGAAVIGAAPVAGAPGGAAAAPAAAVSVVLPAAGAAAPAAAQGAGAPGSVAAAPPAAAPVAVPAPGAAAAGPVPAAGPLEAAAAVHAAVPAGAQLACGAGPVHPPAPALSAPGLGQQAHQPPQVAPAAAPHGAAALGADAAALPPNGDGAVHELVPDAPEDVQPLLPPQQQQQQEEGAGGQHPCSSERFKAALLAKFHGDADVTAAVASQSGPALLSSFAAQHDLAFPGLKDEYAEVARTIPDLSKKVPLSQLHHRSFRGITVTFTRRSNIATVGSVLRSIKTTRQLAQLYSTMGQHGTAWVTARPVMLFKRTRPVATRLDNDVLRVLLRKRLGKAVALGIPEHAPNPHVYACRLCGNATDRAGHHAQACKKLHGMRVMRHNAVVRVVFTILRAAITGGCVLKEAGVRESLQLQFKAAAAHLNPEGARADIAIVMALHRGDPMATDILDVSMVNHLRTLTPLQQLKEVVWPAPEQDDAPEEEAAAAAPAAAAPLAQAADIPAPANVAAAAHAAQPQPPAGGAPAGAGVHGGAVAAAPAPAAAGAGAAAAAPGAAAEAAAVAAAALADQQVQQPAAAAGAAGQPGVAAAAAPAAAAAGAAGAAAPAVCAAADARPKRPEKLLSQMMAKLPKPISGGVEPGAAGKLRVREKVKWWTTRVEIPEDRVYPIVLEDGGYMPPETEHALAYVAKLVHGARRQEVSRGGMPPPAAYGHLLHGIAEKVGLANAAADARLTLQYIRECVPTVVPL